MSEKNVTCPICGRKLNEEVNDDPGRACRRCSDESIDRLLAPFTVIEDKRQQGDTAGFARAVATFRHHDRDPDWVRLRAAARKRWPTFDADCEDKRIAIRIRQWLDEKRPTEQALQRPLVPADTVIEMLESECVGTRANVPATSGETQIPMNAETGPSALGDALALADICYRLKCHATELKAIRFPSADVYGKWSGIGLKSANGDPCFCESSQLLTLLYDGRRIDQEAPEGAGDRGGTFATARQFANHAAETLDSFRNGLAELHARIGSAGKRIRALIPTLLTHDAVMLRNEASRFGGERGYSTMTEAVLSFVESLESDDRWRAENSSRFADAVDKVADAELPDAGQTELWLRQEFHFAEAALLGTGNSVSAPSDQTETASTRKASTPGNGATANDRPEPSQRNDTPTEAERIAVFRVLDGMSVRNPTRKAVRDALKDAGVKIGNQKLRAIRSEWAKKDG